MNKQDFMKIYNNVITIFNENIGDNRNANIIIPMLNVRRSKWANDIITYFNLEDTYSKKVINNLDYTLMTLQGLKILLDKTYMCQSQMETENINNLKQYCIYLHKNVQICTKEIENLKGYNEFPEEIINILNFIQNFYLISILTSIDKIKEYINKHQQEDQIFNDQMNFVRAFKKACEDSYDRKEREEEKKKEEERIRQLKEKREKEERERQEKIKEELKKTEEERKLKEEKEAEKIRRIKKIYARYKKNRNRYDIYDVEDRYHLNMDGHNLIMENLISYY